MLGDKIREFISGEVSKAYGGNKHLFGELQIDTNGKSALEELDQLIESHKRVKELEETSITIQNKFLKYYDMYKKEEDLNRLFPRKICKYLTIEYDPHGNIPRCKESKKGYCEGICSKYQQQLEKENTND